MLIQGEQKWCHLVGLFTERLPESRIARVFQICEPSLQCMLSLSFTTPTRKSVENRMASQTDTLLSPSNEVESVPFFATALHASARRRCSSVPRGTIASSSAVKYMVSSERATQTGSAPVSPASGRLPLTEVAVVGFGHPSSRGRSNSTSRSRQAVAIPSFLRDVITSEVRLLGACKICVHDLLACCWVTLPLVSL